MGKEDINYVYFTVSIHHDAQTLDISFLAEMQLI